MLTTMKYVLTIILVREGRIDSTDGGWLRSERSSSSMQNSDYHKLDLLADFKFPCLYELTAWKHWRNSIPSVSYLPALFFFTLLTLIPNCLNLFSCLSSVSFTLFPNRMYVSESKDFSVLFRQMRITQPSALASDSKMVLVNKHLLKEWMVSSA